MKPESCHPYSLSSKKSWKYFFNLDEVGEAGKDDATDKDEEDQEKKFFVAVLRIFLSNNCLQISQITTLVDLENTCNV